MAQVYLIPTVLHEQGYDALPAYILPKLKECQVFFVENERTIRRFMKQLSREIVIDDFEWILADAQHIKDPQVLQTFRQRISEGKTIGILSEAGCPGIADPGQVLVHLAQELNIAVQPLVGPNSILLALMASGMNGQQFSFVGYLPVDNQQRAKTIRELEAESRKKNATQIFIETPYRNNQLLEALLKNCQQDTRICVAVDITGPSESIQTKTVAKWLGSKPELHKRPAIFLLQA